MDGKSKKKRKQAVPEEAPLQIIPQLTDKIDPDVKVKKKKKEKLTTTCELMKDCKKKKTEREIAEPPTDTAEAEKLKEEEIEGEEELSPAERRVLERKMKKILKKEEKMKHKADGKTVEHVEAVKPIAPQQALDYLTCWAEKHKDWKFQKIRQTWLLQHMFDSEKIPDQNFSVLLTYLEGLCGHARDTTVEKAEALVQELEEGADHMAQQRLLRARDVIQLLS